MLRISIIAVLAILAAAAIWRPAPERAQAIVSVTAAPRQPRSSHRAHGEPSAVIVVYVAGAVKRPGLYRLRAGDRAADAIELAGGLGPAADPVAVNLAARVNDGDEIAVPHVGETLQHGSPATQRKRVRRTHKKNVPAIVNVNDADAHALAAVPGIGPTIAARIVAVRESDGRYSSFDELLDVAGMTSSRLARAQPYLAI